MNHNNRKIPETTISRLFIYLREILKLSDIGIRVVSSSELGDRLNLSDTQVRKDFSYFGQFGTSGSGYNINELKIVLEMILGKDKTWNVCVIGVGHLGSALLSYPGFKEQGLNIVAAFDANAKKIGKEKNHLKIQPIEELLKVVKQKDLAIGIITIPGNHAQKVADSLVAAGIKCIMNFAPVSLSVPEDVKVKNVDLSRELETLSYFLAGSKRSRKE